MIHGSYLHWLISNTRTSWWHDSADPAELDLGLQRGAVGVTTNPYLSNLALAANRALWADPIRQAIAQATTPEHKAEALMRIPVTSAARKLQPVYEQTEGRQGYVCAQVNPARAGDRPGMLEMARRFHAWAPNIAVKLPCTAAGLDVLEDCIAEGITVTSTVSFTVAQALAIGQRHLQGIDRARAAGIAPGRCFAVLMVGRLDDYLRDVAQDCCAELQAGDIEQAGIAVAKRTHSMYQQRGYEAALIIAALRGTHHVTELAGGNLILSIFPSWQELLLANSLPREQRIDREVSPDIIRRLRRLGEFVRAYDPEGMQPADFITFAVTQKTLAQFYDAGWAMMEKLRP